MIEQGDTDTMSAQELSPPISIFCAAAPEDMELLTQWETHLLPLEQAGHVKIWSERLLLPGSRRSQLEEHLKQAKLIILLISIDFFKSDECNALMTLALEHGKARVIPLVLRPCAWQHTRIASLVSLPPGNHPVTSWENRENAFNACYEGLLLILSLIHDSIPHSERTHVSPLNFSPSTLGQTHASQPISSDTSSTSPRPAHISAQQEQERRAKEKATQPEPGFAKPRAPVYMSAQQDSDQRTVTIRKLRRSYKDLMKHSLRTVIPLELGFIEKPDAVRTPANFILRTPNRSDQLLPPGTSITQVYDEAEHELLILGEPGAGKTTQLLDLAQELIERAAQDPTHPLPVILPLSSWAIKKQPKLEDWLVEPMAEIYNVPRELSKQWVEKGRILPLLDGLDEVEETARPACVKAINDYHHRNYGTPLVVCSRETKYRAANEHDSLVLQRAVEVQPLTDKYVDAYLGADKSLEALRKAMKDNEDLRNLAKTPLMLNILILTYLEEPVLDLREKGSLLYKKVLDEYIERMVASKGERMVTSKGDKERYPLKKTKAYLGWLAQQMKEHNQSVFYLEHLQPTWLEPRQQRPYARPAILLPAFIIGFFISILVESFFSYSYSIPLLLQYGILGGSFGWLWSGMALEKRSRHAWIKRCAMSVCIALIIGLSFGLNLLDSSSGYTSRRWLIDGLCYGVIIGLSSLLLQYLLVLFNSDKALSNRTPRLLQHVLRFFQKAPLSHPVLIAVVIGLAYGLSEWLSNWLTKGQNNRLILWLINDLSDGLGVGLSYPLMSLILKGDPIGEISLTERLGWTRRSLKESLLNFGHLCKTLFLACIILLFFELNYVGEVLKERSSLSLGDILVYGPVYGIRIALGVSFSYWLLFGLFQGITEKQMKDGERLITNQGTHRSLRNSVVMGIIGAITVGTISVATIVILGILSFIDPNTETPNLWLLLSGAVLTCILTGGLAVLRHYTIRGLLKYFDTFPWNATRFLDDATARSFLIRVGGGYSYSYSFTHPLLRDHFAGAETEKAAASSANTLPPPNAQA